MSKRKGTYNYVSILIFWNCFETVDCNCILLFVVVIVVNSFELNRSISSNYEQIIFVDGTNDSKH
jgi:hypothetical protein